MRAKLARVIGSVSRRDPRSRLVYGILRALDAASATRDIPGETPAAAARARCARTAAAWLLNVVGELELVVDGVVLVIVDGFIADVDVFLARRSWLFGALLRGAAGGMPLHSRVVLAMGAGDRLLELLE